MDLHYSYSTSVSKYVMREVARVLQLRPLKARSAVLSLLLGAHPPELPVRDLVRAVATFGISESTLRVALSRMVAAGDVLRTDGTYRLSHRLLDRQRRQDEAVHPETRAWRGNWEIAVITSIGRSPAERADLRADLGSLRLAELREGVWARPANLRRSWPRHLDEHLRRFTGRPGDDAQELALSLWDLDAWAAMSLALLEYFGAATHPADRLTAAAGIVRHLVVDPVLPRELLPDDWPGDALRQTYTTYQSELTKFTLDAGSTASARALP
jgi:phenylacetic acid degradation operon negative regulatory protein